MEFMCVCFQKKSGESVSMASLKEEEIRNAKLFHENRLKCSGTYIFQRVPLFLPSSFQNFHRFYSGNSIRIAHTADFRRKRGKTMAICVAIFVRVPYAIRLTMNIFK